MRTDRTRRSASLRLLWIALVTLAGVSLLLAACGGNAAPATSAATPQPTATSRPTPTPQPTATSQPAAATTVQVKMVEASNNVYAFSPATLTIAKGTQVVWTNTSDAPHTVTSDTSAFTASSALPQNQTFKMTFNTTGTFTYHCSIHTYMKATITVTG
jgi:plastocyanin